METVRLAIMVHSMGIQTELAIILLQALKCSNLPSHPKDVLVD